MKAFAVAAIVLVSEAVPALAAEGQPAPPAAAEEGSRPVAVTAVAPASLVASAARRLGGEFAKADIPTKLATVAERSRAAARWLDEVFAPLANPACAKVLAAVGATAPGPGGTAAPPLPADRPIATAPDARTILTPAELAPLTEDDVQRLHALGLLPFEVAVAGECARVVAAQHAGPAPADPLLRLSRASRLEGVARLAGLVLSTRAANVEVSELGLAALSVDRDDAGLPRRSLAEAAGDPVRRAMLRTLFDDGLRWALFHYLKGGFVEVLAALERPGAGPEALLRPGARRRPPVAEGCRLGPRGAAALITGDDEPSWVQTLVADQWGQDSEGRVTVRLWFEDEASATRVQTEMAQRNLSLERQGVELSAALQTAHRPQRESP